MSKLQFASNSKLQVDWLIAAIVAEYSEQKTQQAKLLEAGSFLAQQDLRLLSLQFVPF